MFCLFMKGGWMMVPLLICSMVAATIIIERVLFFKRLSKSHREEDVLVLAGKGSANEALGIVDEALDSAPSPVMRVFSAGIAHHTEPSRAMEAAGIREISLMKRGLVALDTIITLSPLLGLLGTIIGMMDSFRVMEISGLGRPHAVTGGVAEALICTAAGITVAIVALIPYNYFLARIEREADAIEVYATRLEVALSASKEQAL